MSCVCCGYKPTPAEYAEQPYGCPKCEPESYLPSIGTQLKVTAVRLVNSMRRRFSQGPLKTW